MKITNVWPVEIVIEEAMDSGAKGYRSPPPTAPIRLKPGQNVTMLTYEPGRMLIIRPVELPDHALTFHALFQDKNGAPKLVRS